MLYLDKIFDDLKKFGGMLQAELDKRFPQKIDLVTYDELMKFFIEGKKKSENLLATKGVIAKFKRENDWILYQAFLDDENNVVTERYLLAKDLNPELVEAFGDKDLIMAQ